LPRLIKTWVFHALTKEPLMKAVLKTSPSAPSAHQRLLIAGATAALALAAMGFSGGAHARDNVTFSVGIGVPGVVIGATNSYPAAYPVAYPVYSQPQVVYTQPQPVYVQPRPVYTQPRPVYVQPAPMYYQPAPVYYPAPRVYGAPQPVYYGRPHGWQHGHGEHGNRGWQQQGYNRPGYAPVYYQR
jgi:hypothetical protein